MRGGGSGPTCRWLPLSSAMNSMERKALALLCCMAAGACSMVNRARLVTYVLRSMPMSSRLVSRIADTNPARHSPTTCPPRQQPHDGPARQRQECQSIFMQRPACRVTSDVTIHC